MSDAQRERTQREQAARDAGTVDGLGPSAVRVSASAAGAGGGSMGEGGGRDPEDSDRVPVSRAPADERPIEVRVVGRTDVGLVREHNEDNYLLADLATGSRDSQTFREVSPSGLLLAVCDGMGGAAAGEVASQMAVDTIFEIMRRTAPCADRDAFARGLVRSIEEAGSRIFESARADRSRRGMGTTSTVAALMDKTLFVGQVGDSRAYVLRAGELRQITKDQSLVNQLIEAGQLTEDEAEAFEHSNIILQALGTTEQVSVDLTFLELRRGDRLLMCSDGLSGLVHGDVIREVMAEQRDLASCCERLIELAKAGGGHDNVTVILAEFGGEALAMPHPSDPFGYQQYPLPLDQDRRAQPQIHSDMPTLAPPSLRAPPPDDLELPGDHKAGQPGSSSSGRWLLFAMLIFGAAGALYYWMGERPRGSRPDPTQALAPVPAEEVVPERVEVLVRTDVEGAELFVDAESYGLASGGQWVLELPPGPHRLEARAGGSVIAWSLVTVRDGVPATVALSMPEGASLALGDAGADLDDEVPKSGKGRRDRSGSLLAEDASDRRARRARERERLAAAGAEQGTTDSEASSREASPPAAVRDASAVPTRAPEATASRDAAARALPSSGDTRAIARDAATLRSAQPTPSQPRATPRDAGR